MDPLQSIEDDIDASAWLKANTHEPRIGDFNCPPLAETLGLRGMSVYVVFVEARGDNAYGCCRDPCSAYITNSLDDAIRHQRYHHFNHFPFACILANGSACGHRFPGEVDLMNHKNSTGH